MISRRMLLLGLWLTTLCATAQTSQSPASSRLDQMEEIYQKELSMRHIPLLGKYLLELQRLAATATDKQPYQAEIARIQQIIDHGGVVDLIAAQQTPTDTTPMPAPMLTPSATERRQSVIALPPSQATSTTPASAVKAPTTPLSSATWKIDHIAAGTYDIVLRYSTPLLTQPLHIQIDFGGQVVEKNMETERATKDASTFRFFRLGSLTLTSDQRDGTLRLDIASKSPPQLILKNVLLTPSRSTAD